MNNGGASSFGPVVARFACNIGPVSDVLASDHHLRQALAHHHQQSVQTELMQLDQLRDVLLLSPVAEPAAVPVAKSRPPLPHLRLLPMLRHHRHLPTVLL